jgi:methyltransferase (TIGR00027 family)
MTAAAARAAHLIVDGEPRIFADPLAYALLGDSAETFVGYHRAHGEHLVLAGARVAVTTRARYAEDRLAESGLTQYVILGAGLDSFAYRTSSPARVFEVDHPDTQQWKRAQLASAAIGVPDSVAFVAVDFETDSLAENLVKCGFDPLLPAMITWLGVSMYLSLAAIHETLTVIGSFAPGTELILDHMLPAESRDPAGQSYVDLVAPVAAEHGEPWLTFLAPADLSAMLESHGLQAIEQVSQRAAVPGALWERADALRPAGLAVLTHARRVGAPRPAGR